MRIQEIKNPIRDQRVATHSHIKGLGLRAADGIAEIQAQGFVGQVACVHNCVFH